MEYDRPAAARQSTRPSGLSYRSARHLAQTGEPPRETVVGSPVGHAFGGFGRGAGTLSLTVISFSARQRSLILDEPCESDTAAGKRARIRQAERRSAVGGYACLCFASWSVSVWEGEPPTGSVSWPTPSRRSRAAADGSGLRISHHVPRSPRREPQVRLSERRTASTLRGRGRKMPHRSI